MCAYGDAAELTQDKLGAADRGLAQPHVAAIEGGAINPTLVTMANIAAALGGGDTRVSVTA